MSIIGFSHSVAPNDPTDPNRVNRPLLVLDQSASHSSRGENGWMTIELPFDPETRGAQHLARMMRHIRDSHEPIPVEVLKPILDLNEGRSLSPGQRVNMPRRSVERLVEQMALRVL
jgi:hypothetical protein